MKNQTMKDKVEEALHDSGYNLYQNPGLDPEFKKEWIETLRSGEYPQTDGYLYTEYSNEHVGYCCKGVACVIQGINKERLEDLSEIVELKEDVLDEKLLLTPFYRPSRFGNDLIVSTDFGDTCMSLNDEQNLSFEEIAYWLENYVDIKNKENE